MKLATAIAQADWYVRDIQQNRMSGLIMTRAKNGQYMTTRAGSDYCKDRPVWTFEEFLAEHNHAR